MSALTRSPRNTVTGTVGTSAVTVLAASLATNYLKVHNPSGTTYIAVTYDGLTTPVVNGAGTTIIPYGAEICDNQIPTGKVQLVGSTAGAPYTIEWC